MMSKYTQLFSPAPTFTEKHIIDLSSKVYIITGATSGIDIELTKILYALHATIYIGSPSVSSYEAAHNTISTAHPTSQGTLKPFIADLSDLTTIKPAVEAFLRENYRLDVLFLDADAPTANNNDSNLAIRTNCLAPFLLTRLLYPLMHRTTTHFCHINTSIRIVYVSSLLSFATPRGGVQLVPANEDGRWEPKRLSGMEGYMQSKAGMYLLSHEFATRNKALDKVDEHGVRSRNTAGVLHVCVSLGGVKTVLPASMCMILDRVGKGDKYGAYTVLFAGIAPGVEDGDFVIPPGRKGSVPEHIGTSTAVEEGEEESVSARFYEWCEEQARHSL